MPVIKLKTKIHSTPEICFDLSASIDLHQISTRRTKEKAVSGRVSGIIQLNETVTWEAIHFGIKQRLGSVITAYDRPFHFRDEQLKGAFKYFKHDHYFELKDHYVEMTDVFEYASPFGVFGKLFNRFVLTNYLQRFLKERNAVIKEYAETEKWKTLLT